MKRTKYPALFRGYRVGGNRTASNSPSRDEWNLLSYVYKTHRVDLKYVHYHFGLGPAV